MMRQGSEVEGGVVAVLSRVLMVGVDLATIILRRLVEEEGNEGGVEYITC